MQVQRIMSEMMIYIKLLLNWRLVNGRGWINTEWNSMLKMVLDSDYTTKKKFFLENCSIFSHKKNIWKIWMKNIWTVTFCLLMIRNDVYISIDIYQKNSILYGFPLCRVTYASKLQSCSFYIFFVKTYFKFLLYWRLLIFTDKIPYPYCKAFHSAELRTHPNFKVVCPLFL